MMSLIDTLSEQNDSSMAGENMEEAGDDADNMGEADTMRSSAHWYRISGSFRFAVLMVLFFSVEF